MTKEELNIQKQQLRREYRLKVKELIQKYEQENNPAEIIYKTCRKYNTTPKELTGDVQKAEIVFPRHLAIYTIYKKKDLGPAELGRVFNRNHSSVIHAIRSIENYLETDSLGKRHEILEFIHSV